MEEYIGKRVVPRHDGEWDKSKSYEALVIVLDTSTGDSYTSKKAVPAGVALSNAEYWARSGVFNAQLKETYDDIAADNDATEKAIKADNDATEKAIKADNDATETAIKADNDATEKAVKEDNAATKKYVSNAVEIMTAKTEGAVELTTQNRTELEARMASIETRQDANVTASTDKNSDYAAEVVDARITSGGDEYGSLGSAVRRYDAVIGNLPKLDIYPDSTSFKGENGNASTGTMESIQENGKTVALGVILDYVENEASTHCIRCAGCISKEIYEEKLSGKTATLLVYSDADMDIHVSCGFSGVSIKGNTLISNTVVHKGLNLFRMDLASEEFLSLNSTSENLYFHLLWGNYLGIGQPPSGQYHFVMSVFCDEDAGKDKAKAAYVVEAIRADHADHAAQADESSHAENSDKAARAASADCASDLGADYIMDGLYTKNIQPSLTGFDADTGFLHVVLNKDTAQATDIGFSVKIGTRESLTGKKVILYRKEALPLDFVAINAGASWGGYSYLNVQNLFSQLYGSYWIADFDTLMDTVIQKRDAVEEDFQGDIYLMVYGNADWDMSVFETEGMAELHSYYCVYAGRADALIYSAEFMKMLDEKKSMDSAHADAADESAHAANADKADYADESGYAVETGHAADADRASSLGADYIMDGLYTRTIQPSLKGFDDETGYVHLTLTKDTPQAADKGFSVKIGTRESLTGKKIILYRKEALPLKMVAVNAGNSWGSQTYADVNKYFTNMYGSYWIADFDTIMAVIIERCAKVEEDFQGDLYFMMYGNADWDMGIFGTDESTDETESTDGAETVTELHSYYCVYAGNDDALVYTPSLLEMQSDVSGMKGTLDRISEAGLEEKCAQLTLECESLSVIVETMASSNVLWGKKYVACGDSFTQGDFSGWTDENGLSGKDSPVIYDSEWKLYKTYPWWIARRNNMTLVNEALCGSVMALSKEYLEDPDSYAESYRSPFALKRYKDIPLDADYITIWFGINDSGHTNLGTIDDTDNTTFYGAWNVVLEYLITNMPTAKIGIIITNGAAAAYREAEREIAKKWGVPYLDMMGDDQVPVIFGRETDLKLCSTANTLRKNAFYVTSTNGHPNLDAHKYQSTFVEAFLRRL